MTAAARDIALAIRGLSRQFGGLPAVDRVDLTVPAGDRRLILGPNGAGKTTLFNLITGELKPSAGSIALFGVEIAGSPPERCAHRGLARTYQILTLFPRDSLRHNVMLALLGLSPLRLNPLAQVARRRDLAARAEAALAQVGLADLADRPLGQTSYGEKRRLEIALALAQAPRVLLLDEPLAGLSREERRQVQALLEAIPRSITIVLIEHDMDTALSLADTVTVMQHGRVLVDGTRAEIVADPRVKEAYFVA
jgi:branched-chain amino acid transport system ATP-binding protein